MPAWRFPALALSLKRDPLDKGGRKGELSDRGLGEGPTAEKAATPSGCGVKAMGHALPPGSETGGSRRLRRFLHAEPDRQ